MRTRAAVAEPRRDRWLFAAAMGLALWLPLPRGSHSGWAAAAFGLVACALLCAWCIGAAAGRWSLPQARGRLVWSLLLWLAWIGWVAAQLVPLDPAALARWSPQASAIHRAAADTGGAVALGTLSIAPARTADALVLTVAYFAWYWLLVLLCWRSESRIRTLLGVLVVSGTAQALYASLMVLSGFEYGFFEPKRYFLGDATGTFVNRNHLAGYLELCASAGIGLILADLQRTASGRRWRAVLRDWVVLLFSTRARVRICLLVMATALVLTRSRMGNVAFFGSLCLCGAGFLLLRERQIAGKALILFLSLMAVDLLIVGQRFGLERVVSRLEQTEVAEEGRFQLLPELLPVAETYARTGSGLGTFASAYAPFRTASMPDAFDHAHDDYLEFLIETGVPGLLLVLALAGAHGVHALAVIIRRRRRWVAGVAFSTFMALTALAFHSAVDFNLQIPANAATLVALLALGACVSSRSQGRPAAPPSHGGQAEFAYTRVEAGHDGTP